MFGKRHRGIKSTVAFESLEAVLMFIKDVLYAQQGCLYLMKIMYKQQ